MERYEDEDGRLCALRRGGTRRGERAHSEGRPALAALNRALRGDVNIHELHLAFTQLSAPRLAGELIARLRQRRMT